MLADECKSFEQFKNFNAMKTKILQLSLSLTLALAAANAPSAQADPMITSWLTTYSGRYARIYATDTDRTNGNSLTTWSTGTTTQSSPAYCGIQEVEYSASSVYIRSTGLGSHIMGPWYLNAAHTTAFPSYPTNQKVYYRLPRIPTVSATKSINSGGSIGYFVDGVAMFNSWDAYVWTGTTEAQNSTGYWSRDAYINEGMTFDPNNAHQAGGAHHYHANPPGLRYLLGDHVDFNPVTKIYTESTNVPTKHSPILGFVSDGYPIYGPYGYSNATNPASGVRRMISGYVIRDGQYGTSNLTANGRSTLPPWAARLYNVSSNTTGPAVSITYPLGRYMEDNDYLGDHGYTQGAGLFDLDEYNGRYCVTPEYPSGTYAYFVSIASNGTPVFPYNIGRGYYGVPGGSNVTTLGETVVTNALVGPNLQATIKKPIYKNSTTTLTWSATEGGTYMVQSSTNLTAWTTNSTNVAAVLDSASYTNTNSVEASKFYRVARTALATYDPVSGTTTTGGGTQTITITPASGNRGTTVSISAVISSSATPPPPPVSGAPVATFTIGNISVTGSSYTYNGGSGTVTGSLTIPAGTAIGAKTATITFSPPQGQSQGPTYTQTTAFTVN